MNKTKVLLVGPAESGKSTIANVLSEAVEIDAGGAGDYHPTQGVRILEFEVPDVALGDRGNVRAEVELWDCSGDRRFESCWPAMAREVGGVILVCNPDREKEHNKELQTWYSYYVEQQALREAQCTVFSYNKSSEQSDTRRPQLSGPLGRLAIVSTSLEDDGEVLRKDFKTYLGTLLTALTERREQEELNLLNNR